MRPTTIALLAVVALPSLARAQSAADSAAIRTTAHNYIDGWWTGDADRMARALHPGLVKRIQTVRGGETGIQEMTAEQLVAGTRRGGGRMTPEGDRRSDVRILDIFGSTASVRIDAGLWVDYLHLVRQQNGEWLILNVLWELRPR